MKRKTTAITWLLLFSWGVFFFARGFARELSTETLRPVRMLPTPDEERVYFKTVPFIAVDDDYNVYASVNLYNLIFKMDSLGHYVANIGQKGQGPGDILLPFKMATFKDKLVVIDNLAVSFFTTGGKFSHKFKKFQPIEDVVVNEDSLIMLLPRNERLISIHNHLGKRIRRFGPKREVDYSIHKGVSSHLIDSHINRGRITLGDNHIFLVSCPFAEISKFDLSGNLVQKKEIDFFSKEIKANIEGHKKLCFEKGLVMKETGAVYIPVVAEDIDYLDGKLYVLIRSYSQEKKYGEIYRLDAATLKTEKRLLFYNILDPNARLGARDLVVKKEGTTIYFFTAIADEGKSDEIYIGMYKLEKAKQTKKNK